MIIIFLIAFIFQTDQKVDLLKIAGKTRSEVENEIGKPVRSEFYIPKGVSNCQCERVYYKDGNISIVYNQGKADWIRVLPGIQLENINIAKIKFYTKGPTYIMIKTLTMEEKDCCPLNG